MDIPTRDAFKPSTSEEREDFDDAERPAKRKRNRQKASCRPCQRKKTKCDREEPCDACKKRNDPRHCIYDPPLAPVPGPADLAAEVAALKARVDLLERSQTIQFHHQHHAALPQPPHTSSSHQSSNSPYDLPHPFSVSAQQDGWMDHSLSSSNHSHSNNSPRNVPSLPIASSSAIPYGSAPVKHEHELVLDLGAEEDPKNGRKVGGENGEGQDAETEDAVQALEDLALGRQLYRPLGLNSEIATVGNMPLESFSARPSPHSSPPPGTATSLNHLTSVLLTTPSQRTNSTSPFPSKSRRKRAFEALYEVMPKRDVSDHLIEEFFAEIGWMYNVVHRPTFLRECEEFWKVMQEGNGENVDPAWLAVYFQALCWGISTTYHPSRHSTLLPYTPQDLKSLANTWEKASKDALELAEWTSKAQIRTLMAICLRLCYQRPSTESVGGGGEVERIGFYIWLSAAVRIAQLMKLHKLGNDPNKMPLNDVAWPAQACGLKREMAKRIWFLIVAFDWIFCYSAGLGQITVGGFDTDMPINADDDDLGLDIIVRPRPPTYLADVSFTNARVALGKYQVAATEFSKHHSTLDYDALCKLDEDIRENIARLNMIDPLSNPRRKPYHRDLLLSILNNRILRLHRPFFILGWRNRKYEKSSVACLQAAVQICAGMDKLGEGTFEHLWWISAYYMAAIIVVFMNILRDEQLSPLPQLTISPYESLLHSARNFFHRSLSTEYSPSIRQISSQAHSIVEHILSSRQISGSGLLLPRPPAARILRDIAEKVREPSKSWSWDDGVTNGESFSAGPMAPEGIPNMLPPTVLPELGAGNVSFGIAGPGAMSPFYMDSLGGIISAGQGGGLGEGFEGQDLLAVGDTGGIDWESFFSGSFQDQQTVDGN